MTGMLAQAFAMNRPAVVSQLPSFKRLIDRSGGGIVCESNEDYIKAVLRLLNDLPLRKRLQNNIANYVREKAGWSRIALQHMQVYREVMQNTLESGTYT